MDLRVDQVAQDLPLLWGIVQALVVLALLVALYRLLFHRAVPRLQVLATLQERLHYPALAPVLLIPLWFLIQSVPTLSWAVDDSSYALTLALLVLGIEATFAVLFEWLLPRLRLRIPAILVALGRLLVYVGVGVFFFSSVLHVDLTAPVVYDSLWVLLVFFALHLVYRFLFRTVHWRHPLLRALRDRLRFWAYVAVLLLTLAYALNEFRGVPPFYLDLVNKALIALACVLVLETLLVLVFEFYFPQVRRTSVPSVFRDLTRAIIYAALVLFTLGVVFKQDLSGLLVGSTMVSLILGLALQETLGNFFAGLALGISKPYNLGDFIEVAGLTGMVEKIDWRSTAFRTITGDYTVVPNSVMAKEVLQNFSAPTTLHARFIDVGAHYRHPPNQVKRAMLEAAYTIPDVEADPVPEVWLMEFADSSINYRLRYWMRNYGRRFEIDSRVREAIWYHFHRHRIEIPFPIRNVIHHRPESSRDIAKEVRSLLDKVDFLREIDEDGLQILVDRTKHLLYAQGEKVFSQGDPGEAFYLIRSGRVRVSVRNAQGEVFLSKDMHPGEFFGEMALLTGEPRSATVEAVVDSDLLMLGKEALRELLRTNPNVDKIISEVLARRQMSTLKARQELEEEKARTSGGRGAVGATQIFEQLSEQFLSRIRDFFSY